MTVVDWQLLESGKLEKRSCESVDGRPADLGGGSSHLEKAQAVDAAAKVKKLETKAIKEGSDQEKLLSETEQTLRFGLFCLALMYFRSISLLRREQVTSPRAPATVPHGLI